MYYSPSLDDSISDKTYRIIKMRSRGTYHIYGLDRNEYYKRMREDGYTRKDSDILLRDYKDGLLKKIIEEIFEKRTLSAMVDIKCCRDGITAYHSQPKQFSISMVVNSEVPKTEWVTKTYKALKEHIEREAEDKCQNLSGSLYLCTKGVNITNVETTIEVL